MKIEKKSVIRDRVSCNFCKKGQLDKDGKSLVYPYDEVFMFVSQDGGIAPCICQDCLNELFEKSPRTTNDDLEKAAREELIHSYATCVDGELTYQRNAMLNMFRKGARWQEEQHEAQIETAKKDAYNQAIEDAVSVLEKHMSIWGNYPDNSVELIDKLRKGE